MEKGIKDCPVCGTTATYKQGGLRDGTNGKFEDEYSDGIKGLICAISFSCPNCENFILPLHTYHAIQSGKIDPKEILSFKAANPDFEGFIPLGSWLETSDK